MARKRIDLPFDDDSGTAAFLVRTAQLQGKCARKSAFTGTRGRFQVKRHWQQLGGLPLRIRY